jgi:hypothetical protein
VTAISARTFPSSPILVRYRVFGGPVRVDQRLTVFEDGDVELDERHRSRDAVRLQISSSELERMRKLLGSISGRRQTLRERLRHHLSPAKGPRFRLQWSGHRITGADTDDPQLAEVLSLLDEIRLRAIRSQPR